MGSDDDSGKDSGGDDGFNSRSRVGSDPRQNVA